MNDYIIDEEVWKDVVGYEGYYQVSNKGRVRSLGRFVKNDNSDVVRFFKGKILKQSQNPYGYPRVSFSKNNVNKKFLVHRLVMQAFFVDFDEELEVNHIDGVKTNNSFENLEMVTTIDNIRHAHKIGLIKKYGKKLNENDVLKIRKLYANTPNITHQEIADKFGVSDVSISKILRNTTWKRLPHYSELKFK
ncbi:NUMOD4 domain-containing protein [Staphylococcus pseudintermedius]|uniref:NUMOD4 domain-containing protein n=1 Tax=Staphylococcus pseudintermedius TaxID=283734 RepID=UPI001BDF0C55|nr:NUMOD4 domain-containing protein [Staphylococcus pseudintermedius]MDK3918555.1 NUMOD4 domain-containing protein [Staphylococcus pseudintermedius]